MEAERVLSAVATDCAKTGAEYGLPATIDWLALIKAILAALIPGCVLPIKPKLRPAQKGRLRREIDEQDVPVEQQEAVYLTFLDVNHRTTDEQRKALGLPA